ncbi:MAG: acyl-CoA dehydrogenase family protein [Proteobacteria bacterium]|nr:acyl-CoA dehydrogenase family protein [Pseudomonadota bacterium]MBU4381646.1 acyl-CoA dehydrogenase family protein [Pseudomonadota bacterium]MBU4606640.1 acyl-CoA dehydrogenase family protein [Pseudomonadota bacterium]MCG2766633.1 acyl-CoA dehydrogenase family protein [Desulfarculaceae bacterium]
MNFDLSEEHKLIQETARRFALQEMAPLAKECDRQEKYPRELVRRAAEIGLVGPTIPEEYGGPGFGFLEQALIVEQMARVDLGITQAIESAAFGSQNIAFFGTEEQKQKYLPPLAAGEAIAAGAYTEPDAGTDIAAARTKAVVDGDEWVITGNKMFITNGTVCDFMAVFCLTDPEAASPHQRHSLIMVESDRPGVTATPIKGKMGLRASDTAEVAFEEVRVPLGNLVGQRGRGFKQLMHFFDATRTTVAGQGVGLAQGALELAVAYAKERVTFGRPLISNQAIQFTLAEMATRIELARQTTYRAAWLVDQGRPDPVTNSMAKYYAGETAVWVCNQALQIHGGYGYVDEYDISRFYRDAKILEIYEGTKEAEKMVIARKLFL